MWLLIERICTAWNNGDGIEGRYPEATLYGEKRFQRPREEGAGKTKKACRYRTSESMNE